MKFIEVTGLLKSKWRNKFMKYWQAYFLTQIIKMPWNWPDLYNCGHLCSFIFETKDVYVKSEKKVLDEEYIQAMLRNYLT